MKVTIMIGIPGSGKSTWVKANRKQAVVCSADHYHTDHEGIYDFKVENAGKAHQVCLRKFLMVVTNGHQHMHVVVDNTNTTLDQIAPYIAIAQAYDADVEVVHMNVSFADAFPRNIHNVPKRTVMWMNDSIGRLLRYWPDRWPKVRTV